jgi:hypothetical protein
MSPWGMMNEWGIPPLEMASLTYQYVEKLAKRGAYVPQVVLAGGFSLEDHVFKALALGAPYVKAVGMARAPLAATMGTLRIADFGLRIEKEFIFRFQIRNPQSEIRNAGGEGRVRTIVWVESNITGLRNGLSRRPVSFPGFLPLKRRPIWIEYGFSLPVGDIANCGFRIAN